MTILPHHVAGTVLVGGLTVGGYFTVRALIPPSLENKVKELGLELTSDWGAKEQEYKKAEGDDLINGIAKPPGGGNIEGFEGNLSTWCNKWKLRSFEGDDNFNYRRFSLWCTVTKKIQDVLSKRGGLTGLTDQEIKGQFATYSADTNTDKFTDAPATGVKKPLTEDGLVTLCTTKKAEKYKYESDDEFKKVVKWCYKKA